MMHVIPEYTVGATLGDGAQISLRVQKPDLEAVIRTLVESAASVITITFRPGPTQSVGSTVTIRVPDSGVAQISSLTSGAVADVRGH